MCKSVFLEMTNHFYSKKKKNAAPNYYDSLTGHQLILSIRHHERPNVCTEFIVRNASSLPSKRHICVVTFILILILVCVGNCELNPWFLLIPFIFIFHQGYQFLWSVNSESLLVIAPIGLQLTVTFVCGYQTSQFIPWYSVQDVIINESISLQRVIYYLAAIIECTNNGVTSTKLVPLFQYTKPRLKCLEQIYVNVQSLIHVKGLSSIS